MSRSGFTSKKKVTMLKHNDTIESLQGLLE